MSLKIPVQSIRRCFDILEILASRRTVSITEVARSLGVNTTTAHNLMKSIVNCGYAINDGKTHLYSLSNKFMALQSRALLTLELSQRIESRLARFSMETGEPGVVAMLVEGSRQVLCRTDGSRIVRVDSAVEDSDGNPLLLATGRVMFAVAPEDVREKIREIHGEVRKIWGEQWSALCREIVVNCIYIDENTRDEITALAIPIEAKGFILSLGSYMPKERFQSKKTSFLETYRKTAEDISAIIGG
ncbi:MAG: helix-turn-helix domain-containing protein [Planctomycetes bacterium]|nr:helix-turn-helix domain-containing protein [Planctomycetota bacterium]